MIQPRRTFLIGMAALAVATRTHAKEAMEPHRDSIEIQFRDAFPTPIYKKSYFGAAVTGVAIVGAGALTYFTAGAGAPAAATGVSTVASWVAGGGAGSYMAGLSTIGGWFGGNAMLGSAIMNGISIGAIGGTTGALTALGKVSMATAMSATALDGILIFANPATKSLDTHVELMVPTGIGSRDVRNLMEDISHAERKLQEALAEEDREETDKLKLTLEELKAVANVRTQHLQQPDTNPEDFLVLGIYARRQGQHHVFDAAMKRFDEDTLRKSGYLAYLRAVSALENGESTETARQWLTTSMNLNDYAIEPALLMINLLAHKGFAQHDAHILDIARAYDDSFDTNKYQSPFSLVSLRYRIGSLYLFHEQFEPALEQFTLAYKNLRLIERTLAHNPTVSVVKLGQANALYGMKDIAAADAMVREILKDADSDEEVVMIKSNYAGPLDSTPAAL